MTFLADSNVLIALSVDGHVHHAAAQRWFGDSAESFATCPITQGALVREVMRGGDGSASAAEILRYFCGHPRHEFWPDDIGYFDVAMSGVIGHRQVTDAYLAELARRRNGRVATFDRGFAALHSDVAALVPVGS